MSNDETLRDRLRRLTDAARARAEAERVRREAAEREAARGIIEAIPGRAEDEASRGKTCLAVMEVTYVERPVWTDDNQYALDPSSLSGPSRYVWDWCVENALEPMLVPRWTSLESGVHRIDFSLVVRW